jgi:hypothetical protein
MAPMPYQENELWVALGYGVTPLYTAFNTLTHIKPFPASFPNFTQQVERMIELHPETDLVVTDGPNETSVDQLLLERFSDITCSQMVGCMIHPDGTPYSEHVLLRAAADLEPIQLSMNPTRYDEARNRFNRMSKNKATTLRRTKSAVFGKKEKRRNRT